MRRLLFFTSLLVALATVDGCVSVSDSPTLFVGMSRDRLRSRFGEPLRVEQTRSGGEDWYYCFASWRPDMEASSYNDGVTSSVSVSATISDQSSTQECPVHLSSEGYVMDPLPAGKIVKR